MRQLGKLGKLHRDDPPKTPHRCPDLHLRAIESNRPSHIAPAWNHCAQKLCSSGFRPLHQSAHNARDLFRPSTISVVPAPSSPPPSPPLCTLVPVWPSTRQPWPPPISVLEGGSLGAQGLSHGDSDGTHLP